jgi:ATP-dependent RNA helicase RhlE
MLFSEFDLDLALLRALSDIGFTHPTAIQQDAIPPALEGRDVLGTAMTGSGKTAAFLLPILNQLLDRPRGTTRALIVTPTRELAAQIDEHLRALAPHTDISSAVIHGGVAYEPQERAFRVGVDVVIATPGRLLDHLRRPYASLKGVEFLVLDEADRMLDMGFIPDVRRILQQLPRERQTMLFSATMPAPVVSLAREFLREPVTINIERKAAPASGITQVTYPVRHELKAALFLHLLERGGIENALAFTRTKDRADRVAAFLEAHGVAVTAIHGDRSQIQRTRALEAFKKGEYRVLVATDVAARGLDLVDLTHVVNIDVPAQPEDYIHRVGRTARYEATGDAITFFSARELADLHAIERVVGSKLPRLTAEGFDYEGTRPLATPAPPARPRAAERRRPVASASEPRAERRAAAPAPPSVSLAPPSASLAPPSVAPAPPPAADEAAPSPALAAGSAVERFARLRARREGRRLQEPLPRPAPAVSAPRRPEAVPPPAPPRPAAVGPAPVPPPPAPPIAPPSPAAEAIPVPARAPGVDRAVMERFARLRARRDERPGDRFRGGDGDVHRAHRRGA